MPTKLTQADVDEITAQVRTQQDVEVADTALSIASYAPTGISGEVDASDFSIPYVSLVQASSDAVKQRTAQAGSFLSTDGQTFDAIDFVPLHIQAVRDFYDSAKGLNICGSHDRITGYPRDLESFRLLGNIDVTEGVPMLCRECPFYDFAPGPRLSCAKGYVVTAYNLTTDEPFMYRVRGTAVRPFRDRFVGAVAMGRSVPWARSYQMSAQLKSNGPNSWFVPTLEPIQGFDEETRSGWAQMAAQFGQQHAAEPSAVDPDDLPFED